VVVVSTTAGTPVVVGVDGSAGHHLLHRSACPVAVVRAT
jgi:hypothetical protein